MYASEHRRIARDNLSGKWGISIGITLLAAMLGGAFGSSGINLDIEQEQLQQLKAQDLLLVLQIVQSILLGSVVINLVHFLLGGPVRLGYCTFLLNQHDGKPLTIKDLFSQFYRFGAGFCLQLLTEIYVALWSLLLVIPGIVASYSYAMAPFILAENPDWTASEAINASKEMMRGHRFELFCLEISFIGWALLSAFTLGIGSLFLNPYMAAARASFYRNLCTEYRYESLN